MTFERVQSPPSILVGAVASTPHALVVWESLREHFRREGVRLEYALYSTYEQQVEALLGGHIDVAWNSPLAHARVRRRTDGSSVSLAMRNTDRDNHSRIVVHRDAGITSLDDLHGRTLAVGSADSTAARILPLHFLAAAGVNFAHLKVIGFDADLGKHGDTGTSEREVLASLRDGRAHAGAVSEKFFLDEQAAGRVDPEQLESIHTTPGFDGFMFDALQSLAPAKRSELDRVLSGMEWDQPQHRALLEAMGLKHWVPPRPNDEGYTSLLVALEEQGIA